MPEGLTDVEINEVQMKRSMVERCRRVVGVLDARKWGRVAAATFADLDQIDVVISDTAAPADLVDQVRQRQIRVLLV